MKALRWFVAVLSFVFFIVGTSLVLAGGAQHKYVGVSKCKICHKTKKSGNQYGIWMKSKHAQAYEVLKGQKAAELAKKKGITKPPYEAPECLQCHVTAYGVDASLLAPTFKKEDGVQCETCHGPGSDYKKRSVMKNRQKAIANGLKIYSVKDGSAEKLCKQCHNPKSPSYKEFKFNEFWAKIKHPKPRK